MFTSLKSIVACGLVSFALLIPVKQLTAQDAEPVDFVEQIQPIFEQHCVRCHGEVDPENMRMDQRDEVMDYLEANDAENSLLYELIISEDDDRMPPPDENDPLSKEEIALVARWIDEGATWPDGLQLKDRYTGQQNESDVAENQDDPLNEQEATAQTSEKKGDAPVAVPSDLPAQPAKRKKNDKDVVYWAVGSLHPAVVHLPIGLLMAAGLFGLLGLRGNFVMSDCAYYCLWLGTLGCVAACITGWWFSPMAKVGTVAQFSDLWDQEQRVFWHRTASLIVTIVALLLALYAAGARNRDPDDGVLWKLGLVLLAIGIGWTGHKGGELTHGKHHYKYLKQLMNSVFPMDEKVKPEQADQGVEDAAKDADATGTVEEQELPSIDLNNDGKGDLGVGRDT